MGNIDIADFFSKLIIHMVIWIFAVSAHEAAHAWMSLKFGDDTAQRLGRVTLNPLAHIDLLGTIILPIIGFIASYSPTASGYPLIGWGKPTPVNPLRWRRKDLANVMVSIAGILANLLIATIGFVLLKLRFSWLPSMSEGLAEPVLMFLELLLRMNISLAVFNLLPFPPL